MSVISLSKVRRRRRFANKKHLKDKYNYPPKVAISIDPIEAHRFTYKMIEALTEFMEKRNAILSKIGIHQPAGIVTREWETESGRVDSVHGESIESEQSRQPEDGAKTP